jgi:hypothetical protein
LSVDLTAFQPWIKFLHIAGAFLFVAGHGVSMAMVFRLRQERDPERMKAILDLSSGSLNVAGIGLLVLLVAGIVGGIVGGYFGQAWIWVSLVLLIVIGGLMTPLAGIHFGQVRAALGMRTRNLKPGDPDPVPLPLDEVLAMTRSRRPDYAAAIGGVGLLAILWLMTFKPF